MSWSFFVVNADLIAKFAACGVACLGLVAVLLVTFGWRWTHKHYREVIAKVPVAVFRAVAGASAIQSRFSPAVAGDWIDQPGSVTLMASIAGWLCWEVAGYVGDDRFKRAKAATLADHVREITDLAQSRDDAVQAATRLEWLLAHLREPVSHELQRVRRVVAQNVGPRVTIQQVREGLDSDGQIRRFWSILPDCSASMSFRRVAPYSRISGSDFTSRRLGVWNRVTPSTLGRRVTHRSRLRETTRSVSISIAKQGLPTRSDAFARARR